MSDIDSSRLSFLTDFKWFTRCGFSSVLEKVPHKTLATSTYLRVNRNDLRWAWLPVEAPYQSSSFTRAIVWLIDRRSPGSRCNLIALEPQRRFPWPPLIQYSHVRTVFLAAVWDTGSVWHVWVCRAPTFFFQPVVRSKCCVPMPAGHGRGVACRSAPGSCVNHLAWLSSERQGAAWMMASYWCPWNVLLKQSRIWTAYLTTVIDGAPSVVSGSSRRDALITQKYVEIINYF